VTAVGAAVKAFKPGDLAGVGCMVDSCQHCAECEEGFEQFCAHTVFTYNSPDKHTGKVTYGGYSNHIVVDEGFVLHISQKMAAPEKLAAVAPLLCAGITTYSPLRHWNVGKGDVVGIVGLGGLGHMGLKWAHAFGAETVLFTTSPDKAADARRMGADDVVISKDPEAMQKNAKRFDFIINTVAVPHDLNPYLASLKRDGVMCMVGVPESPHPPVNVANLIFQRRSLVGSLIGGIKETQEMLDFSAEHGIVCDIETIAMHEINTAYERMLKSDVKYRFVIDMSTLKA
jgi:uncharacterized zinc-type alcohol dehydrogenase-like protein